MKLRVLASTFVLLTATASSRASPAGGPRRSEPDQDAARQQFESGREQVRAGRCDLAVGFFRASVEAAPNVGAWLNLGDCLDSLGQLQEAYEAHRAAQALAAEKRDERLSLARWSAERIQARMVTIVVSISPGVQPVEVTVDGAPIRRDRWSAILVSPNASHTFVARAPDVPSYSREVWGHAGETVPISVVFGAGGDGQSHQGQARMPKQGSLLRTSGIVAASLGEAAWVGAGVFGIMAALTRGDLANAIAKNPACIGAYPNETCAPSTRPELDGISDRLETQATTATVLFVGGALLLAGGIAMIVSSPSGASPPRVTATAPPRPWW